MGPQLQPKLVLRQLLMPMVEFNVVSLHENHQIPVVRADGAVVLRD